MAEPLVAVHGQSDQHRLLQPEAQRDALDAFAGERRCRAARPLPARLHADCAAIERELREVRRRPPASAPARPTCSGSGWSEIEAVDPQPGEDAALATEESRLGFADTLRTAAETAREALSVRQDAPDALGAVAAARRSLESVREHDPEAAALADRVAEVSYLLVRRGGRRRVLRHRRWRPTPPGWPPSPSGGRR